MIGARRVADAEIGAEESGSEFPDKLLDGVGVIAEPLAELPIAAALDARCAGDRNVSTPCQAGIARIRVVFTFLSVQFYADGPSDPDSRARLSVKVSAMRKLMSADVNDRGASAAVKPLSDSECSMAVSLGETAE